MDETVIVYKIQKMIKERYQGVGESMIAGGVDSMDKYKYMLGQAHALQLISQEISNLLTKKEQKNEQGNVVDLGKGNSKDSTRS
jgi:hypothetical protein